MLFYGHEAASCRHAGSVQALEALSSKRWSLSSTTYCHASSQVSVRRGASRKSRRESRFQLRPPGYMSLGTHDATPAPSPMAPPSLLHRPGRRRNSMSLLSIADAPRGRTSWVARRLQHLGDVDETDVVFPVAPCLHEDARAHRQEGRQRVHVGVPGASTATGPWGHQCRCAAMSTAMSGYRGRNVLQQEHGCQSHPLNC